MIRKYVLSAESNVANDYNENNERSTIVVRIL